MKEFKRLPNAARFNMLLSNIKVILIFVVIAGVVLEVIGSLDGIPMPIKDIINIALKIILGYVVIDAILESTITYSRYKYRVTEDAIEKVSGVLYKKHEIVPIHRMQQIELEENFLNRIFKLSKLHIITSGGKMSIEYVSAEEGRRLAEELKLYINGFAQEDRTYGEN